MSDEAAARRAFKQQEEDAARVAELETDNERLTWMLNDLSGAFDTKDAILADLESRWASRSTP